MMEYHTVIKNVYEKNKNKCVFKEYVKGYIGKYFSYNIMKKSKMQIIPVTCFQSCKI